MTEENKLIKMSIRQQTQEREVDEVVVAAIESNAHRKGSSRTSVDCR